MKLSFAKIVERYVIPYGLQFTAFISTLFLPPYILLTDLISTRSFYIKTLNWTTQLIRCVWISILSKLYLNLTY